MMHEIIPNSISTVVHIKGFGNEYLPFSLETSKDSVVPGKISIPQASCASCCDAAYSCDQRKWAADKFSGIKGITQEYVCTWKIRSYTALEKYLKIMDENTCLWASVSIGNGYYYPENCIFEKRKIIFKVDNDLKEHQIVIMDKCSEEYLYIRNTDSFLSGNLSLCKRIKKSDCTDIKTVLGIDNEKDIVETEVITYYSDIDYKITHDNIFYIPVILM